MDKVQKIVAAGLLQYNGRILLIRRSLKEVLFPGYFEFPSGKVEFGEDPVKALEREFLEETNLKIKVGEPIRTFSYVSDEGQRHSVEIVFRVSLVSNPLEIKLSDDHDEYRWVLPSDVDKLTLSEEIRKSLNMLRKIAAL